MESAGQGGIHDEHPFATPVEQRDPARLLRGRLAVPVTIVTAGSGAAMTGLTVSSVVVAEGDPPVAYCLIGPTTDLYDVISATSRFVMHVAGAADRTAADIFAGVRPSPGGLFATQQVELTDYGPRLSAMDTYAMCSVISRREESYSALVAAAIDEITTGDLADPLVYFRGSYRHLTS